MLLPSSTIVNKKIFEEVGCFSEKHRYGLDIDLWARIASKYDIAFSSKVCAVYHRDAGVTLSLKKERIMTGKSRETLETLIKNGQYRKKDDYYIKEYYNKLHLDTALKYIKAGNKKKAKEHLDKVKTNKFFFKKAKLYIKYLLS